MNQYFLHRLSDAEQRNWKHRTGNFFLFKKSAREYSVFITVQDRDNTELTASMDTMLTWIGKNVNKYWSFALDDGYQLGADQRTIHFSFDDLEEATLFRLRF